MSGDVHGLYSPTWQTDHRNRKASQYRAPGGRNYVKQDCAAVVGPIFKSVPSPHCGYIQRLS